ncbi:MAG: hypothetical protein P8011_06060 [Acidihalobacter sp.]|uniref:hypothetical protein n=1 Tax=Acidihalobacter sp. TaxID=1872108 RepID=UPI00307E50F8
MKIMHPLFLAFAIALCVIPQARAVSEFAGSTWPEQVVQEITATEQYAKQATEVATQLQQLENQVINMANLGSGSWSSAQSALSQLAQTVSAAEGISYAAQNSLNTMQQNGNPLAADMSKQIGTWRSNYTAQVKQYLQLSGLGTNGFSTLSQALNSIAEAGNSASGRKAVLQAGNQIAATSVQALQSLSQQLHTAHALQMEHQQLQDKQQATATANANADAQNWNAHGGNAMPNLNQGTGGTTDTIIPAQGPANLGFFN